jgi:HK97 family phage major capsid protein
MNIAQLERDLETTRTEGLALLERTSRAAEAENREMTDEERTAIQAISTNGQAIQARIAAARNDESMIAELRRLTAGASPTNGNGHKASRRLSLGQQFIGSDAYAAIKGGLHRSQSTWRTPSAELDPYWHQPMAATLTEDPASGGALVQPQYIAPGILAIPQRPLMVGDLFASGTTGSNQVVYMREKTWVNAAAPVLEGGIKPESTLIFESAADPVRKIAHWLPVSEEMLEDVAQITSYIDARLRLGVLMKEEDQLLNGTGIAPELAGLLGRAGLTPDHARVDPETNADAMLAQTMIVYAASFLMPDAYIMNPVNWTKTILTKTSTGEYYTGGPFSPIQSPTLWGLPVAVTPATAAGNAVVGAFKTGAQIFRHGGLRVEASNSHADFFIKNLVAIRAEERLALAVYRPAAFGEVTGLQ